MQQSDLRSKAPKEYPNHSAQPKHSYDAREAPEYYQYNQHNHAGHDSTTPVETSHSIDSTRPQRNPTTPAQLTTFPFSFAPDGAHLHMEPDRYPPTDCATHGLTQPISVPRPAQKPPPQDLFTTTVKTYHYNQGVQQPTNHNLRPWIDWLLM
jgi:hypothetical protein